MESPQVPDLKRQRIMECAMAVVLRYGFQRTTMDDVAKEAGISRPALYLLFRNKTEIYKAIAGSMMGQALDAAKTALTTPEPVEARVFNAIKVGIFDPMDFLTATPHGAELLDIKHAMAAEALQTWREKKAAMIAGVLNTSGVSLAKGMSGALLADALLDGIEGLKLRARTSKERERGARALVKLIAGENGPQN